MHTVTFKDKLYRSLPWIWLAAGYLINLLFIAFQGKGLLDSDMASEMVLARVLNREGAVITQNWYYSTEIRVFNAQLSLKLGLALFPHDWHAARVLAAAVMVALFLAAYLLFAKTAGFKRMGVWTAAALMWPFGRQFWYLGLYGTYYLTYMIFSLLSMAAIISLLQQKGKPWIPIIALALLGFGSGLNGVRQLMVFYVPVFAAAAVLLLIKAIKKAEIASAARAALGSLTGLLGGFIGYWINANVLAKNYHFYSYTGVTWTEGNHLNALLNAWDDFLKLFGYQSGVKVMSIYSIAVLCGLLLAILFIVSLVRLCRRAQQLNETYQLILAYTISALIVMGISFSFLSAVYNSGFWVPLLPFAFAVFQMEGETESFRSGALKQGAIVVFACSISICTASTLKQAIVAPYRADAKLLEAAQWLDSNGYTQGYATFWNSNAVIEMTDGRVEMYTMADQDSLNLYAWLQETAHMQNLPQGKIFLLLSRTELGQTAMDLNAGKIIYENDNYIVLLFDSIQQIKQ